jgi:hypothetical protein
MAYTLSAVKTGLQSQLLLSGWCESDLDFDKKRLNMCLTTHNPCPSPHAKTLKNVTSLPSTQLFVIFGGYIFQQSVIIPLGTNIVPLLVKFYFKIVWGRLHNGASQKTWTEARRSFNFTFRYLGDVLSLYTFGDFVDHIYHIELQIKDTQIQLDILYTLTYTLKNTVSVG